MNFGSASASASASASVNSRIRMLGPDSFSSLTTVLKLMLMFAGISQSQSQGMVMASSSPQLQSPIAGFINYGSINQEHTLTVPNYVNGFHQHYFLNNLLIERDGFLATFSALFTLNNDPTVTGHGLPVIINIHVARPSRLDDATANTRQFTYIQTIQLSDIVSGERVFLPTDKQLQLHVGDMLSLSVPNNRILLRIGPNTQGLAVPYAVTSVSSGSSDDGRTGTFSVVWAGSSSSTGSILQLCTQYGTIESTIDWEWSNDFWIFPIHEGMIVNNDGYLTEFQLDVNPNFAQSNPFSLVRLSVAYEQGGLWYRDISREISFTNVGFNDIITVNKDTQPLFVKKGESVGVSSSGYIGLSSHSDGIDREHMYYSGDAMGPYWSIIEWANQNLGKGFPYSTSFTYHISASTVGDPLFAGFQGQSFQFHGLADEHFNLISSTQLQLNSHFVYLSAGNCNYNNTVCWQHPGTYLDILGFIIPSISSTAGDVHIKLVAGAHADGLRVWMSQSESDVETEISLGSYPHGLTWMIDTVGNKATLKYNKFGEVSITTPLFDINVVNSDFFFNLGLSLLDHEMLRVGSAKHTINDHQTCNHDKHGHAHVDEDDKSSHITHDHGLIENILMKKYHITYPLHGLIGQTWRNVRVCDKDWMGGVNDYVVSSLFGGDYYYNFYNSTVVAHA